MAKVGFKLRIQILLLVDLVHKGVQTNTVVSVLVQEKDADRVLLVGLELAGWDHDVMILEGCVIHLNGLTIDFVCRNFYATEVEELIF